MTIKISTKTFFKIILYQLKVLVKSKKPPLKSNYKLNNNNQLMPMKKYQKEKDVIFNFIDHFYQE